MNKYVLMTGGSKWKTDEDGYQVDRGAVGRRSCLELTGS